jgi:hypothetical protein
MVWALHLDSAYRNSKKGIFNFVSEFPIVAQKPEVETIDHQQ